MPVPVRLVSFLGALGTLLCVVGCLGVWYVESRIDGARVQVFERIDQSLSRINDRLVDVQKLAAESKITVEEVQQRLRSLAKKEASGRFAERFDVEARVQRLTAGLRQAELMLELSHETVDQVGQVLEMGVELGLSLNADTFDLLLERIAEIQGELSPRSIRREPRGTHRQRRRRVSGQTDRTDLHNRCTIAGDVRKG